MENISLISNQISIKLKEIISNKKLSQKDIVVLCKKKNIRISQATISNALNKPESMSLSTLIKICEGLNIYIPDLLSDNPLSSIDNDKSAFIMDASDSAYYGYMKLFHVYFLPTTKSSTAAWVHGTLLFEPDNNTNRCLATMKIDTGETKNNKPVIKHYKGNLVISLRQRCAYCTLVSKTLGEICLLVFKHDYLNNNSLYCTMANAVTSSAGRYRHPTVHRLCLSSEELDTVKVRYLIGELLLINDAFFISENKLKNFLNSPAVSAAFKNKINNVINHSANKYYMLSEKALQPYLSDTEFAQNISLLKSYSEAPANNKITAETEDVLYNLLKSQINIEP